MIAIRHSFFLDPGLWRARGRFFDAEGGVLTIEGETEMSHEAKCWRLSAVMRLPGITLVELRNDYRIRPLPAGGRETEWASQNSALGRLAGRFTLIEDTILSVFASSDGRHGGVETMWRRADDRYLTRGTFRTEDALMSSWAASFCAADDSRSRRGSAQCP